MAGKTAGGIGQMIWKIILFIFALGLLIAVLRVFNWDPFGVINWIWNLGTDILLRVSDFFTGNRTYQQVFSAPGTLWFPFG